VLSMPKTVLHSLIGVAPIAAMAVGWGMPSRADPPVSPPPTAATSAIPAPLYHPPRRGAPAEDGSGGASRGPAGAPAFSIKVLAPGDHVGLTRQEQPTLYWYASAPITAPVEITLTTDASFKPLIDQILPAPQPAGIHAVTLAGTTARLQAGPVYQWAVAVILNPQLRSADLVSSSAIQRVDAPAAGADTASLAAPASGTMRWTSRRRRNRPCAPSFCAKSAFPMPSDPP